MEFESFEQLVKKQKRRDYALMLVIVVLFIACLASSCSNARYAYGNKCMSSKFIGYSAK